MLGEHITRMGAHDMPIAAPHFGDQLTSRPTGMAEIESGLPSSETALDRPFEDTTIGAEIDITEDMPHVLRWATEPQ